MILTKFDYQNIIIFGGTGTIGTICAEVLVSNVKYPEIYLVTNNEQEIWEAKNKWKGNSRIRIIFGDIRDRKEIRKLFIGINPQVIINCAALKHVDYCEDYIMNAIKTNILGLENLLYLSNEYEIRHFLQISTDKAVEPISVMGATKMLGERLCREWNKIMNCVSIIRLGNVVDSRGSLIPTLNKQLENANEVYYTDEKMYRYLITIKELYKFLVKIFEVMEGGEIFIPKMEEYNILDFIKSHTYSDTILTKIGRRKGEKYREKFYSEYEKIKEYKNYYKITMEK